MLSVTASDMGSASETCMFFSCVQEMVIVKGMKVNRLSFCCIDGELCSQGLTVQKE